MLLVVGCCCGWSLDVGSRLPTYTNVGCQCHLLQWTCPGRLLGRRLSYKHTPQCQKTIDELWFLTPNSQLRNLLAVLGLQPILLKKFLWHSPLVVAKLTTNLTEDTRQMQLRHSGQQSRRSMLPSLKFCCPARKLTFQSLSSPTHTPLFRRRRAALQGVLQNGCGRYGVCMWSGTAATERFPAIIALELLDNLHHSKVHNPMMKVTQQVAIKRRLSSVSMN